MLAEGKEVRATAGRLSYRRHVVEGQNTCRDWVQAGRAEEKDSKLFCPPPSDLPMTFIGQTHRKPEDSS